jgi:hypothetical protein
MNSKLKLGLLAAFIAAAFAIFTGCAIGFSTVTIQATKDPSAVQKIGRLFILINHGDLGHPSYSTKLAADLQSVLSNPPPVLKISLQSPLELDESVYDKKIQLFKPDAVLVIRLSASVIDEAGGYPMLKYDVSLFDPTMKKRLWRGAVDNSGGTAFIDRRMHDMAETIVNRLREDGFL